MSATALQALVVTTLARSGGAGRALDGFLQHHGSPQEQRNATIVVVDDRFAESAPFHGQTDGPGVDAGRGARVVSIFDLFDLEEAHRLLLAHPSDELVEVVLPHALAFVAEHSPHAATLLLPDDAEVWANLDDLVRGVDDGSLVLVPARLTPLPIDGFLPDAIQLDEVSRRCAALAIVGPGADDLLSWWKREVSRSPLVDPLRASLGHDSVLSRLPPTIPSALCRDPSVGVSFLNADEPGRQSPRLVRFLGFAPDEPWLLSKLAVDRPRIVLSRHGDLARGCRARASALSSPSEASTSTAGRSAWPSVLPSGRAIDAAMRLAYRKGLMLAEAVTEEDRQPEPPNPFVDGHEAAFLDWLNASFPPGSTLSRYLEALHRVRDDLSAQFPDANDPRAMPVWAHLAGRGEGLWPRLLPTPPGTTLADLARELADPRSPASAASAASRTNESTPASPPAPVPGALARPTTGVNLVGYLRAEFGMGEASRLMLDLLERAAEPHAVVVDENTVHRQQLPTPSSTNTNSNTSPDGEPDTAAAYDVNVVVANADAISGFANRVGPAFFDGRYTIGLWFWEVEHFPAATTAFELVDEVWVASEHVRGAIAAATSKPVRVVPLGASLPPGAAGAATARDSAFEARLGLGPDRFVVSFSFDYASVAERKNPWGLVEAYRRAFPEPDGTGDERRPLLVIKTISSELHLVDRERLLFAIGDRPDVVILDGYVTAAEHRALLARTDCYVSLHRAEGWGLTMAEAMALGTPVVATGYSGNLEFMNDHNSWLVPFTLVDIGPEVSAYAGCGRWADPDLDAAASIIRWVRDHPVEAAERADQARRDIEARAADDDGPRFVRQRLEEIRAIRHQVLEDVAVSDPKMPPVTEEPAADPPPADPPVAAAPAAIPERSTYEHPGLGPVSLPTARARPEPAGGAIGAARRRVDGLIGPEVERQDANLLDLARAMAEAISLTRLAVTDVRNDHRQTRLDLDLISSHTTGLRAHLDGLQASHDRLAQQQAKTDAELAARFAHELDDVRGDIARIEEHVGRLTSAIERLARRLEP